MGFADGGFRVHVARFARCFERHAAAYRLLVYVDFLVIIGAVMMVMSPHYYIAVKWIGLAFMLVAVLWSHALREKVTP
jgi:hypothetical protein